MIFDQGYKISHLPSQGRKPKRLIATYFFCANDVERNTSMNNEYRFTVSKVSLRVLILHHLEDGGEWKGVKI